MVKLIVLVIASISIGDHKCSDYLEKEFVHALVKWESGGNPSIEGVRGDRGLMQVTHIALKEYNKSNEQIGYDELFQVRKNLKVGIWTLCRSMIKYDGDKGMALKEYHGGARAVKTANKRVDKMLDKYADGVLAIYNKYMKISLVMDSRGGDGE